MSLSMAVDRLAATGAEVTWIIVGAAAVVVLGIAAFLISRRGSKK